MAPERLDELCRRAASGGWPTPISSNELREAVDEIRRLNEENARLRACMDAKDESNAMDVARSVITVSNGRRGR